MWKLTSAEGAPIEGPGVVGCSKLVPLQFGAWIGEASRRNSSIDPMQPQTTGLPRFQDAVFTKVVDPSPMIPHEILRQLGCNNRHKGRV